ncbi:MAG TPA: hypothetical protein VMS11_05400 [Solirubrobacterales bacterium]|nr:hypothetical protein [Solirubrobacterales bacterium]
MKRPWWRGLVWVWALVMLLSSVPAAAAASGRSSGELGPFAECPLARPSIEGCVQAVVTGGSLTVGWASLPLTAPIVLQGGFEATNTGIAFFGASDGETLSAAPQPVPGLTGMLAVTATVELAGPASGRTEIVLNTGNLLTETGTALTLPVVVKLDNRLLGDECTIGSSADSIEISLTTGLSGSLQGSAGELTSDASSGANTLKDVKLVAADFSVGLASGCGGSSSWFVDPLLNLALGLPAATGESSAVLEADLRTTPAAALRGRR